MPGQSKTSDQLQGGMGMCHVNEGLRGCVVLNKHACYARPLSDQLAVVFPILAEKILAPLQRQGSHLDCRALSTDFWHAQLP